MLVLKETHQVHLTIGIKLVTLVVMGSVYIGRCKYNYSTVGSFDFIQSKWQCSIVTATITKSSHF
jgi:hypothetical protein